MTLLTHLWERWKRIAHAIGDIQARVILSLMYLVLVAPFAIAVRVGSDPLLLRRRAGGTWLPRPDVSGDPLAYARRQF